MNFTLSGNTPFTSNDFGTKFYYPEIAARWVFSWCGIPHNGLTYPSFIKLQNDFYLYFVNRRNEKYGITATTDQATGFLSLLNLAYQKIKPTQSFYVESEKKIYPCFTYDIDNIDNISRIAWDCFTDYWDWFVLQVPSDLQITAKNDFESFILGFFEFNAKNKRNPDQYPIDWPELMKTGATAYLLSVKWPNVSPFEQSESQNLLDSKTALINISKMPVARSEATTQFLEDPKYLQAENTRITNLVEEYHSLSDLIVMPAVYLDQYNENQTEKNFNFSQYQKYLLPVSIGLLLLKIIRSKRK